MAISTTCALTGTSCKIATYKAVFGCGYSYILRASG